MNFELIWELAKTDFKVRYNGSVLGYCWALLRPLLIFLILNVIFSRVFSAGVNNYSLNLLTGLILWGYYSDSTKIGLTSLYTKGNLISKVNLPRSAIIIASTVHTTITFVINLFILGIFFVWFQVTPGLASIGIFILYLVLFYFLVLGFTFLTAPLFLKYRDLDQIWEVLLTLGFYATPIIYPLSFIPDRYQSWLWLNPASYLIHYSKLALIENHLITLPDLVKLILLIGLFFGVGLVVFNRYKNRIAEML